MKTLHQHLPLFITVSLAAAALFHGPIGQPPGYHDFADQKIVFGIPHFADVVSNLGFALVAAWGWLRLAPASRHPDIRSGWAGYSVFLIGLLLTALGSSWYHLAPDNASLVWDRLPIALACGGLLAGVGGDVQHKDSRELTALLSLVAVLSVGWWHFTELSGQGDLRPYLLLQGLPILLIPLWQWIYRMPGADRMAFGAALAIYVLAKFAELNDHEIAAVLGAASGHTLKHLLATSAAALIVGRLVFRVQPRLKACADACPPAPPSAMNACR